MKKSILLIAMVTAPILYSNLKAQVGFKKTGPISQVLPKVECPVRFRRVETEITGNNTKSYTLVKKTDKFTDHTFTFKKTGGRAKTTYTVFVNGIQNREWTFEGSIETGERTISFNNLIGKEVIVKLKNHSATNKIEGYVIVDVKSNSMLYNYYNPFTSNKTLTQKITEDRTISLLTPCNGKGTINVSRLGGTSSAEIVVTQGGGSTPKVLYVHPMAAGSSSIKFNIKNINPDEGQLKLTIKNIETGKFIRVKIGAWFN